MLAVKRVYEPAAQTDGFRILTDRLWPRGMTKEKAQVDVWLKEIAPSTELREWFHHDASNWTEFKRKYLTELHANPAVAELKRLLKEHKQATLLYGARDEEHNQAVVLKEFITSK